MWQRLVFVFIHQTFPPVFGFTSPLPISGPSLDTANNSKYVLIAISDNKPKQKLCQTLQTCDGGNCENNSWLGVDKESCITAVQGTRGLKREFREAQG